MTSKLIGKKVTSIAISGDRQVLTFGTDGGDVVFNCEADCCSQSWIEAVEGDIVSGTVTEIEEKEVYDDRIEDRLLPTKYTEFQQEDDQRYFYEIKTNIGSCTVEMRNSSNGYYGGSLREDND